MLTTSAIFFTGGAPNSLTARLARDTFHYNITWMNSFIAAAVPGLISLLVIPYVIYRLMNPELKRTPEAPVIARQELAKMGPMSAGEKGMTAVFLLTLLKGAT